MDAAKLNYNYTITVAELKAEETRRPVSVDLLLPKLMSRLTDKTT